MAFGRVREPSERMCTSFLTYLVCYSRAYYRGCWQNWLPPCDLPFNPH